MLLVRDNLGGPAAFISPLGFADFLPSRTPDHGSVCPLLNNPFNPAILSIFSKSKLCITDAESIVDKIDNNGGTYE